MSAYAGLREATLSRLPDSSREHLRIARQQTRWELRRAQDRLRGVNPLLRYFEHNEGRQINKWMHYFDVYHRHFERFRGEPITMVEFGVQHGGSLQMWRDYFGPRARLFGVDIDPRCLALGGPNTEIIIGDQEDRDFLRRLAHRIGTIDVVVEDGGHFMGQQIATFEEIYPRISTDGVFLIEDLHTSYWPEFDGAYRDPNTFIEYAKGRIDQLNAWYSRTDDLVVDQFTHTTDSMHIYDSIIVFEKTQVVPPVSRMTGNPSFVDG